MAQLLNLEFYLEIISKISYINITVMVITQNEDIITKTKFQMTLFLDFQYYKIWKLMHFA